MVVAGGGVDGLKLAQAFVQPNLYTLVDAKGAHPAGGMADPMLHLIIGDHLGLGVEGVFILVVVHLGVALDQNQHGLVPLQKGQRLGDHPRLHAQGGGRFGYRAGGDLRLDHMVQAAFAFQMLLCFFQRHNTSLHFAKNTFPVPIISPFAADEKQAAEKIR